METKNTADLSLAEFMSVSPTGDSDVFVGQTEEYGMLGIYGGHFVGQALAAGFETVEDAKLAHSLHCYFLRKGNPEARLEYHVTSLRDGYGSDVRSVSARQDGKDVFHMIASFTRSEEGSTHQKVMPEVISPAEARAEREAAGRPATGAPTVQNGRSEIESITPPFLEFDPKRDASIQQWIRVPGSENLSDRMKQVLASFLSDGTLMFNANLPHGSPFVTHRLTSLDHSVWFHRVPEVADWMMFDQRSTAAAGGRGLNEGEIYNQDGSLLLSCSQESMLRSM